MPNSLIHETSPYLLQHAHNPVQWYPWGVDALAKAKAENKLILVSIGYSACHWCHVMEHESFEDEAVANIMNEHFVCIKIDREERPDIDQVYMLAVQLMTGSGGWPLNSICLPDQRPIYGGTYFKKEDWKKLLLNLASFWTEKPQEAEDYANKLTEGIFRRRIAHQAQGSSTKPAPKIRRNTMSSGARLCAADARAMTMKDVQIVIVVAAASQPTVLGVNVMAAIIRAWRAIACRLDWGPHPGG